MKNNPLYELSIVYNGRKRSDVAGAVQGTDSVNFRLAEIHELHEPESTRTDITNTVFDKMTTIEKEILYKKDLSRYLGATCVQLTAKLQESKESLNNIKNSRENDEIVDDIIGG